MIADDTRLVLVETMADLVVFHEWANQPHDLLGFDVETDGLNWWNGALRLGQIGDQHAGWAFDLSRWSGAVIEVMKGWKGPIVGSNIGFDVHWFERETGYELPWHQIHDTVIQGRLINSVGAAGLKRLATKHIDAKAAAGDALLKEQFGLHGWSWGTVPIDLPEYWTYGALDPVLAALLCEELGPQLTEQGLDGVYAMERAVQRVSYRMERNGILVDQDYCHRTMGELDRQIDAAKDWLKEHLGLTYVTSNKRLAEWFLQEGEPLFAKTEDGNWQMDKEVLNYIIAAGVSDRVKVAAAGALKVRRWTKIRNTYLKNFVELSDSDGILHPQLNTLQARTGRQSVSRPSLQNLIRGPEVRDAFIARPGRKLIMADFDQIEIRLLAHFCRDPRMIQAILAGNIHVTTGQLIYNDPSFAKGDPRYVPVKNTAFSKIYGAGIPKFALTAGIPLDQAAFVYGQYDKLYPGVPNFIGKVIATGRERARHGLPWVRTPSGRLQYGDAGKEYVLVNYLIQGAAADVMKAATVRVADAGLQDYMMLTVHDELVLDVPDEDVDDVIHTIQSVMPDAQNWVVPLTVGVDVYDRWGDKYRAETA